MTQELRRFIYLDPEGIRSLYAQLSEFSERERRASEQKKKSTSGKGQLNLKVIAGLFGGSAETELTQSRDSEVLTERKLIKEDEQKLVEIETALSERGSLLEVNTINILAYISVDRLPAFIRGRLPLTTRGFYDKDTVKEVMDSQTVTFRLYITDKSCLWPLISMGGSLSKFIGVDVRENGTAIMGYTSHLAIMLRALESEPHDLGVLGQIHKTGSSLYIKPYAIWM
jgi:hypothetical protein